MLTWVELDDQLAERPVLLESFRQRARAALPDCRALGRRGGRWMDGGTEREMW